MNALDALPRTLAPFRFEHRWQRFQRCDPKAFDIGRDDRNALRFQRRDQFVFLPDDFVVLPFDIFRDRCLDDFPIGRIDFLPRVFVDNDEQRRHNVPCKDDVFLYFLEFCGRERRQRVFLCIDDIVLQRDVEFAERDRP